MSNESSPKYKTFEVYTNALNNGRLTGLEKGNIIDCLPIKLKDIEEADQCVLVLKDRILLSHWTRTTRGFMSNPYNPNYSQTKVSFKAIKDSFEVCRVHRIEKICPQGRNKSNKLIL